MRVAVVGSAQFAEGMEYSVQRGFAQAGCTSVLVRYPRWDAAVYLPRVRGTGLLTRYVVAALRPAAVWALLDALREAQPDLVFFVKCDDLPRLCYRALRGRNGPRLAAFHPDDPFNRGSWLRPGPSHRRAVVQLQEVDHYFVWAHRLVPEARRRGARHVEYLPFGCDPTLHDRSLAEGVDVAPLAADVCFVGNWDKKRERWLAPVARLGVDLAIWGTEYWATRCGDPALRAAWRGRALHGRELVAAVASSRVCLNVLRAQNEDGCNMRTFEIPCAGGFMLHERSADLPALFAPGEACADFATPADLVKQIRWFIDHPDERRRIAERGYQAAMAQTYCDWARRIVAAVDVCP